MPRRTETTYERRLRMQRELACRRSIAVVLALCEQLHAACNAMIRAARAAGRRDSQRRRVIARHDEVLRDGRRRVVLCILTLVFLPGMLLLDGLLAGGTVDFLLTLTPDLAAFGYTIAIKFIVLAFIIAIELKIAVTIMHEREEPFDRSRLIIFVAAGVVLATFMSYLSFVLTAAKVDVDHESLRGAAEWLPWAAAALTLTLHCLAIFSGESVRMAFERLSFWLQIGFVLSQRVHDNRRAEGARQDVGRAYRAYLTAIDTHTANYPETPVSVGPFEADLMAVLKTLFPNDERLRRLDGGTPPPVDPDVTPPPPAPVAAPPAQTPDPSAGVDSAYSQLVAEEEARRADSEVTL